MEIGGWKVCQSTAEPHYLCSLAPTLCPLILCLRHLSTFMLGLHLRSLFRLPFSPYWKNNKVAVVKKGTCRSWSKLGCFWCCLTANIYIDQNSNGGKPITTIAAICRNTRIWHFHPSLSNMLSHSGAIVDVLGVGIGWKKYFLGSSR